MIKRLGTVLYIEMYNVIILECPVNCQVTQSEDPDTQPICSGHSGTAGNISKPVAKQIMNKTSQITADAGNAQALATVSLLLYQEERKYGNGC
jgi:hypothetical protein